MEGDGKRNILLGWPKRDGLCMSISAVQRIENGLQVHILIKLSPYQHLWLRCIVSLIASFCSINPQYLLFLSIFLHAFTVDSPIDFLFCCQFVCTPNGTTAEPDNLERPAKPRERVGGKSFQGC